MEPPFAVQLLLARPPVERARPSPCAGTVTGSAVLADECVGTAVRDIDDFAARLRPNYLEERGTAVIEAPVDVGSYRAKCKDVEVVENFDGCIGAVLIEIQAHTAVFRRESSDSRFVCLGRLKSVTRVINTATTAVRCRPRTTRGGEPAAVPTAMTWLSMGPHWPGHSPTRKTNESSPGVSPVPSECGLEPNGVDRPNPMVGFPRLQAREEVKLRPRIHTSH